MCQFFAVLVVSSNFVSHNREKGETFEKGESCNCEIIESDKEAWEQVGEPEQHFNLLVYFQMTRLPLSVSSQ